MNLHRYKLRIALKFPTDIIYNLNHIMSISILSRKFPCPSAPLILTVGVEVIRSTEHCNRKEIGCNEPHDTLAYIDS